MSAAKYIKALKAAALCGDQRDKRLSPYEEKALTKYLLEVLKNAPFKSYFKALVCNENLGGISELDDDLLDKICDYYVFDMTYSLFNTDGFEDYKCLAKTWK